MSQLTTEWNLGTAGDDVYAALVDAHQGLSDAESHRLNTRLVLLLTNHIGDAAVVREALTRAREGLGGN